MPASTFATRLTAIREAQGKTRYRLAKDAGLTTTQIGYLETGQREPGLSTILALCQALGVTPNALMLSRKSAKKAAG
jgi:transcriptional regulator with XRE-family HTH domain